VAELKQKKTIPPKNPVNPVGIKTVCWLCCQSHMWPANQRSSSMVTVLKLIN